MIAITEDWCGDAMVNIPILLKLAEAAGIEVKMILRDENLELMDQYLTNGTSRSIPIFIFIDGEGKERMVWDRGPLW
ncbi:thioredoxin family protein [Rossellomorea sp. H39__3]